MKSNLAKAQNAVAARSAANEKLNPLADAVIAAAKTYGQDSYEHLTARNTLRAAMQIEPMPIPEHLKPAPYYQ